MVKIEKTVVLCFKCVLQSAFVGFITNQLERKGLTILGLKYMSVNTEFTKKHFSREGRIPRSTEIPRDWVNYTAETPVTALLFEGEDAIKRAFDLMMDEWTIDFTVPNFTIPPKDIYSSDSDKSATEDIELWFSDGNQDKWSDEYCLKKDLIFAFWDGKLLPGTNVQLSSFRDHLVAANTLTLRDRYYLDTLVFILIRSVAVRERLVGEILYGLQKHSFSTEGLKLVNMNVLPENIALPAGSSSSETTNKDDDYNRFGVAMILDDFNRKRITNEGKRCFYNPKTGILEVDRDLIYISEPGVDLSELIERCFPFGYVLRPNDFALGILEASLAGL